MDSALASRIAPSVPIVFQDALGERRRLDGNGPDPVEVLCLRSELTAIPSFEFALRERAGRLTAFRHANYSRVRGVDRLNDPAATLAVVSDHTRGLRLASLLSEAGPRPITIDITVALHFIRQLVSAVAMLHESARDIAHGAIGPERLIVTPNARIVVVEYVLGAALEQLRFSRERYWRELRIALPSAPGLPRFDHRADVTQIGVVALSLILGRMLHEDEFISQGADLVASAKAISPKGGQEPLPAGLRNWLGRALQLDARHSFASAPEARAELEKAVAGDTSETAISVSVPNGDHGSHAPASEQKESERASVTRSSGVRPMPTTEAAAPPTPAAVRPEPEPEPSDESEPMPDFGIADARDFTPPEPRERGSLKSLKFSFPSGANKTLIAASVAGIAILSVGGYAARRAFVAPVAATVVATGTLNVSTNPAGAEVLVDGERAGVTPLTLSLKAGPHNVELRGAGEPRTVPVTITAGTQSTQYIELPRAAPATVGQLQIRTEPAGASVSVDGTPRGRAPLLIENLRPGDHSVVLESEYGAVRQTVSIAAATTASLVVPLAPAEGAPVSGWLSVTAPVDVQIFENKRLLGTSQSERIMVSTGKHEIEIVNEILGYRTTRTVQVPAGRVTAIKVEWPRGTMAINAVPWAEVWVDGERVGETPIGNYSLPIGPHEIVFRHPELGELRQAATVTLRAPARVSVDLRKKP
jgi:serine/threonine protein kinase